MKETLKIRIKVEHTNSILHRSFKRLSTVSEKSMKFNSYFHRISNNLYDNTYMNYKNQ